MKNDTCCFTGHRKIRAEDEETVRAKLREQVLALLDLGFTQVRVRIHGNIARIEILPADFERFNDPEIRLLVNRTLKNFGFSYITIDLEGYRTGSMNEVL